MSTRKQIINNFLWRFFERCGAKGVTFIVSIVLARLLDPSVYGTIALITVFTTIMQAFVDGGFGNALIQKKNADNIDFSTVFFFNIAMCMVLYLIMYISAPYIAKFYKDETLVPLIRVLSLVIIISGIKNVQQAYVSRNLMFKKFFFATLGGTLGAAVLGISMAYLGYGVWALVCQMIFNVLVDTIILWITVKWRPCKAFSWSRLKGLFSYGWKLLVVSIIDAVYNDIRQLIIGKKYSKNDLAYYNKGNEFPSMIVSNINASIDSVLFPTMSLKQDDKEALKAMTRRAIKTSSFILWPIVIGLAVCADSLVRIILTDKWIPCVPYLRIFCVTYGFYPIFTANFNSYKAVGKSNLYLMIDIIQKVFGTVVLLFVMKYGVMALAYSLLFTSIVNQLICTYPNKKLLNYSYFEQIKDILPNLLIALIMGILVSLVQLFGFNIILTLFIQISVGVIVYIVLSKIFHIDSFEYLLSIIKSIFNRRKMKEEE